MTALERAKEIFGMKEGDYISPCARKWIRRFEHKLRKGGVVKILKIKRQNGQTFEESYKLE